MDDGREKSFNEKEASDFIFHPEVRKRISEMSILNKKSLLAGRGSFDKVFGHPLYSEHGPHNKLRMGTLLFSFIHTGYKTEDITVLDQQSVSFKIKHKSAKFNKADKKNALPFECPECGFKCWWNYIMVRHVRKEHTDNGKLYVCTYCTYYCVHKDFYHSHMIEKHSNKLNTVTNATFDFVFGKNDALNKDLDSHKDKNGFYCPECKFCAQNQHMLSIHIKRHETEKPFKCSYCEYRYKRKNELKSHEIIHTGGKLYRCKCCEFCSKTSSSLKRHEKIHTDEKPFSCKICQFRCRDSYSLKTHEMIHTGEKPYSCKFCSFRSRTSSGAKGHEATHSDDKPFQCSFCEFRSKSKSSLKTHKMTHTGEKPFECTFCEFRCITSSNLKMHIKRYHKIPN